MLNVKIAVYVPSTVKGNQPAPSALIAKWVRESKIRLANLFGGFTSYHAEGMVLRRVCHRRSVIVPYGASSESQPGE